MEGSLNLGDDDFVRRALEEADLRVLLMVLFHLSGDRRWLQPPFQPRRDVSVIAAEDAGLDAPTQAQIRAAAYQLLSQDDLVAAIDDPGDELMLEMMRVCLGEKVPPEYAPMMREEVGFCTRQVSWSAGGAPAKRAQSGRADVVIVGAGASGLALAANLAKLGVNYVVFEQNDEVGGTWYVNQYPGAGVDTPNHAYSFSFGSRYRWSRYFAPREQLQDYLERSATALGVRPNIRFGSTVTGAAWDEPSACWRIEVTTPHGRRTVEATAFVSAIGQLSQPSIANINGAQDFEGPLFHSAHWPKDLDLKGKRVAVVGTGASAMQIVPTIVDEVAALTVYQRNAQWARPIPRYHDPISEPAQWLLESVPFYAPWFRLCMLWRYGDGLLPTLRKDPNWPHPERSLNRSNDRHREQMAEHILNELDGRPDLIDKCLPTYPPYGKRILIDNGWFKAIRKANVELVTDDIDCMDSGAITTVDGQTRAADVVVFATGFRVTALTARLDVTGRGGAKLADAWAGDNPTAYLGITVPGFPNLFCMQGPNTGLAHGGSAIFQSECQARYISGCIVQMSERDIAAIDVKAEIHDDYVKRVDAEHEQLIWTHPGMSTYYRNQFGRVVSISPWRLVDYWSMTHDPDLGQYEQTRHRKAG